MLIYIILAGLAYVFNEYFSIGISFYQSAVVLTGALIISFIVSAVFFSGFTKSEPVRVQRTLIAVGLKFLLYGILAAVTARWLKSLSMQFVLTFFIIYLAFTVYLLSTFFNVLKYKKL